MRKILLSAILTLATTAAAIGTAMAADLLPSLAGSEWGFPDAGDATIKFDDGRAAGSSGCNRFSTSYTFTDGALTFGPIAGTRMACPPDKMEIERKVLAILEATKAAEATHKTLLLKDAAGATLATLQRRDWD